MRWRAALVGLILCVSSVAGAQTTHTVDVQYGELYETVGATTITVVSLGTYYPWVNTTAGISSGMTVSTATDDITVAVAGDYRVTVGCSFSATANAVIKMAIHEEGTIQPNCIASRKVSTGGDVGRGALSCLLTSAVNDSYTLEFTSTGNGDTVTPTECHMNAQKVGG